VTVQLKLMFIYHYVIMTITSGRKSGCMITWPLFVIMKTYPFTPTWNGNHELQYFKNCNNFNY